MSSSANEKPRERKSLGRQELDDVGHQKLAVEVDEAAALAEDRGDAELAECVVDHDRGRGPMVLDPGGVAWIGAKKQLIADRRGHRVEDRLAAEPECGSREHDAC